MRCPRCNNKNTYEDLDDRWYCEDCGYTLEKHLNKRSNIR